MTPAAEEIEIRDAPEASRFEILVDGRLAGFAAYRRRPEAVAFTHTEIDEEYGGRGLGGKLVGEALARVRAEGLGVLPFCPFVRAYIDRHPEAVA